MIAFTQVCKQYGGQVLFVDASFQINRDGDQFMRTGTGPFGSRTLVNYAASPALARNEAYARLGYGGPWIISTPTPSAQNIPGEWL